MTDSNTANAFVQVVDNGVIISPSATKLGAAAYRQVAVCASHGGRYAAWLAIKDQVRGLILNDAGVGLNQAGIGGLKLCEANHIPAATVSHDSCRIGDAHHMYTAGRISHTNANAASLGVYAGMMCKDAARQLTQAPFAPTDAPHLRETRQVLQTKGLRPLVLVDSASLVVAEDRDAIVICGSHGGLVGGRAHMAIQADVFAAAYNDAGIGFENAGITRLAALDERRIAGLTVSHDSAEIGNAQSMLDTGRISHLNEWAEQLGARQREPLTEVMQRWRRL